MNLKEKGQLSMISRNLKSKALEVEITRLGQQNPDLSLLELLISSSLLNLDVPYHIPHFFYDGDRIQFFKTPDGPHIKVVTEIAYHPNLFRKENELLLSRMDWNTITVADFVGHSIKVLSEKEVIKHLASVEKRFINSFTELFKSIETDSPLIFPIDYPYRDDINVYTSGSKHNTVVTTKDNKEWIGGHLVGDRYIRKEYRGKGLGIETVLIQARNPAIGNINGTGYYSEGGYRTRMKAFEILKKENAQKLLSGLNGQEEIARMTISEDRDQPQLTLPV